MRITLPINFSQYDDRWAKHLLGTNTDSEFDIYNYGCLLCSLTSLANYYGKTIDPLELNQKLIDVGGFVNGGEYVDGSITKVFPDIIELAAKTPDALTDEQMQMIKDSIDGGNPVIIGIDYNPKTVKPDYHFVLIVGYNKDDENDFTIVDPLGGFVKSLKGYLGWFKPNARKTIEKIFIYSGPQPVVSAPVEVQALAQPAEEAKPAVEAEAAQPSQLNALPANYDAIIHNSDQWDQTVSYLELGKESKDTGFEEVKRVIAGIKSRQTDLDKQRIKALEDAATKATIIENQKEDISNLQSEVTTLEKQHRAELYSLKQTTPSFDSVKRQYDDIIDEVKGNLKTKVEEVQALRIELAKGKVKDAVAQIEAVNTSPASSNPIAFVISLIKRYITVKL